MQEQWKDVSNYEGIYQVSNQGRIKNVKTGRILKQQDDCKGYLKVILTKNNKGKRKTSSGYHWSYYKEN